MLKFDSLAPARSVLADLLLRTHSFRRLPSGSSVTTAIFNEKLRMQNEEVADLQGLAWMRPVKRGKNRHELRLIF